LKLHGLARIETAMDPFLGLGSTAVACAKLGVHFIGSDIDETYLQEALERVSAVSLEREERALPGRGTARMRKATLRQRSATLSRLRSREAGSANGAKAAGSR
jgi:hypothetical protein